MVRLTSPWELLPSKSKTVEADLIDHIRDVNIIKFICNNIQSQFGILRSFVFDNEPQFVCQKVKKIEFYNSMLSYL